MKYNNAEQLTTLCYILNDKDEVLLIKKKRGLGAGMYNGPGGKVKRDETPQEAIAREVKEETGLILLDSEPRGFIEFVTDGLGFDGRCYIFISKRYRGKLKETKEARPHWVKIAKVPCDNMWKDDRYWLKDVLFGRRVNLRFYFNKDCKIYKMEKIT